MRSHDSAIQAGLDGRPHSGATQKSHSRQSAPSPANWQSSPRQSNSAPPASRWIRPSYSDW